MISWLYLGGAMAVSMPALYLRLAGWEASPLFGSLVFGIAIVGAAFLLSWAVEVAQMDISQSLALALLALIAILPEYAVDIYFAWSAAYKPEYVHYAVANMTGANRLLIGFGWSLVIFLFWLRHRGKTLELEPVQTINLSFMGLATLYAFFILLRGVFLKSSLNLVDGVVLIVLFGVYLWGTSRAKWTEPELFGPAATLGALRPAVRRGAMVFLFLFSAAAILASAQPFADGLVHMGKNWGIDEFILVQWVAPLASEAPEIIIASLFVLRGNANAAMGALMSSKVNQWSLLVGSLPIVFAISAWGVGPLPLDSRQTEEVLLTAAQSIFAIVLLSNLRFSIRSGVLLYVLFGTQLFFPSTEIRYFFSGAYLLLTLFLLASSRSRARSFLTLLPRARQEIRSQGS